MGFEHMLADLADETMEENIEEKHEKFVNAGQKLISIHLCLPIVMVLTDSCLSEKVVKARTNPIVGCGTRARTVTWD